MKAFYSFVVVACLVYVGWVYEINQPSPPLAVAQPVPPAPVESPKPATPVEVSKTVNPPKPLEYPKPPVPRESPKPIASRRRLAPAGVLYLLGDVSVKTDSGVVGFPAGSLVIQVRDSGDSLLVQAKDLQFEVAKSVITNDLDAAYAAWRAEWIAQNANNRMLKDELQAADAKEAAFVSDQDKRRNQLLAAKANSPVYSNPLNRGAYNSDTQARSAQEAAGSALDQIEPALKDVQKQYDDLSNAGEPIPPALAQEFSDLRAKEQSLLEQYSQAAQANHSGQY